MMWNLFKKPQRPVCKHIEAVKEWKRQLNEFKNTVEIIPKYKKWDKVAVLNNERLWIIESVVFAHLESQEIRCPSCGKWCFYSISKPLERFEGIYSVKTLIDNNVEKIIDGELVGVLKFEELEVHEKELINLTK